MSDETPADTLVELARNAVWAKDVYEVHKKGTEEKRSLWLDSMGQLADALPAGKHAIGVDGQIAMVNVIAETGRTARSCTIEVMSLVTEEA